MVYIRVYIGVHTRVYLREFGFASERPLGDLRVRIVVGMGSACSASGE